MKRKMFCVYSIPKIKSIVIPFLISFTFSLRPMVAQESVLSAGSDASGSTGMVSFSIGQINFRTLSDTSGSLVEGVQQPYTIFVLPGIEEVTVNSPNVSVYPNPATGLLLLRLEYVRSSGLGYELYDAGSKLIFNDEITANITGINMTELLPATYFLKVIQENKVIYIIKIIKN